MLSLCRRCTRQEADAEEAFSRAGLLLYRKLPAYLERVDNLRGWILRLTFNVCMSLHREHRRRAEQSLEEIETEGPAPSSRLPPSPLGNPESTYLQKELGHFLRSSIEHLPERLRETMIGHLTLDGYREIADRLAINEANARKRMQEAREALARGLVQYRASGARPPAPRPAARARKPAGAGQPTEPQERVRAIRSAVVTLPGGQEREGLLALHLPLSKERRDVLERYVEQHPRGGTKRLALARALLEEGRAEEALPHLEAGVERQPRRLDAWLDLIAIYRLQERTATAAEACERALAANRPATALLQGLRARCLGSLAEAERGFLEAREAMPESPAPCVALAELQMAAGRPHEAAESLAEALARDPDDVAALTLGAEPLRLLGRSAESRRRDARALELDPANPPALERLLAESARRARGRLAPEGGLWRAVESLARTRPAARSLLAFVRIAGGDLAGIGEMASLVAEHPNLLQARIEHARLQDALDRPLAALQEIDAARELQPGSRELDLLACRVAIRAGLPHRALQECDDLLARHGDAWDIASTAAWALSHLGQTDRAIEISKTGVASQPDLPAAWLEHGRVLTRAERLREAAAATEMGWSLLPEGDGFDLSAAAALDLAVLHWLLGYPEWARQWALLALDSCAALGEIDPARARIFRVWIEAELGTEDGTRTAPPMDLSPSFLQIEERRLLSTQVSEASLI